MARNRESRHLTFPVNGVNVVSPRYAQPGGTCVNARNVQVFDSEEGRARGGIRYGLSRYLTNTFDGGGFIQDINYSTTILNTAPNTTALGVRSVKAMAISNGTVQQFNTTTITNATVGGSATLSSTAKFMFSAEMFGKLYITDGINYKVWDAATNATSDYSASAGSLPGTPGTRVPRLVERWGQRLVFAGLRDDPHNWFMTAVGVPDDFDYAPNPSTIAQAVTGSVGPTGKIGEVINCLIPYTDDILIFGCDNSIYQLAGDPMEGGTFELITDKVGMAFGRPWTKDDHGNVYFFSSRGEVYVIPQGSSDVQSLTANTIDPLIKGTNLSENLVRMEYEPEKRAIHVWITPFSSTETTHYVFDLRTGGWFPERYASQAFNPMAVKLYDGDDPDDRRLLVGSKDGRIRFYDPTSYQDDSTSFIATVTMGPIDTGNPRLVNIVSEIRAVTDINGNQVSYEVLSGDTHEEAAQSEDANFSGDGQFEIGMSSTQNPRARGYAHYIKIGTNTISDRWGIEQVIASVDTIATDRGRIKTSS